MTNGTPTDTVSTVLVIPPEAGHWPGFAMANLLPGADVIQCRYPELTTALVQELAPDVVLCSALTPGHDVMDVAGVLQEAGFEGQLIAVMATRGDASVIAADVNRAFPDVRLKIVSETEVPRAKSRMN